MGGEVSVPAVEEEPPTGSSSGDLGKDSPEIESSPQASPHPDTTPPSSLASNNSASSPGLEEGEDSPVTSPVYDPSSPGVLDKDSSGEKESSPQASPIPDTASATAEERTEFEEHIDLFTRSTNEDIIMAERGKTFQRTYKAYQDDVVIKKYNVAVADGSMTQEDAVSLEAQEAGDLLWKAFCGDAIRKSVIPPKSTVGLALSITQEEIGMHLMQDPTTTELHDDLAKFEKKYRYDQPFYSMDRTVKDSEESKKRFCRRLCELAEKCAQTDRLREQWRRLPIGSPMSNMIQSQWHELLMALPPVIGSSC